MGFTAVDGLMMGTRCGSIDPGVLIYLMDERGMDARALETPDLQEVGPAGRLRHLRPTCARCAAQTSPQAREAIDLFIYRIVREIGSLAAALGGLDGLVFTGGIGQNDTATRSEVVAGCGWLGAELDEEANENHEERIESIVIEDPDLGASDGRRARHCAAHVCARRAWRQSGDQLIVGRETARVRSAT